MTQAQFTLILAEIRFVERDLQLIAERMEELVHKIDSMEKRNPHVK